MSETETRTIPCDRCHGEGVIQGWLGGYWMSWNEITCPICHGAGLIVVTAEAVGETRTTTGEPVEVKP